MAPLIKSKFINQIGQLLHGPRFEGSGGRGGYTSTRSILNGLFGLHRPRYDYESEAGPLWQSSIPATCLSWERRASIEAECVIQKRDKNGDWANAPRHRALDVLSNPNPFFDIYQLLDAVRFDFHLTGNAYLHKARSSMGKVVQLWWIPSWLIEPRWSEGGNAFIECYEYTVNGESHVLLPRDVIHFRNGIDPRSQGRRGLSDFAAVVREVCTDNEAATIAAALCRNMGIPGVDIVSQFSVVSAYGALANPPAGGNTQSGSTVGMLHAIQMEWSDG